MSKARAKAAFDKSAPPEAAEILVVDDSVSDAFLVKAILEKQGYRVSVALDGSEALALLRTSPIRMVITDIEMPAMNGCELSLAIKKDPDLARLPVILLTDLSRTETAFEGLKAKADCYLTKPIKPESIIERMRDLLANPVPPPGLAECEGLEVWVNGQRHIVTADRRQILSLLVATYESAVEQNRELTGARLELSQRKGDVRKRPERIKPRELNFHALSKSDAGGVLVVDKEKLTQLKAELSGRHQTLEAYEKRLKNSESNFRALLENSPEGMIVVDQARVVRFVNPAAEVLLRRAAGGLLNRPFAFPLVPDETREIEVSEADGEPVVAELHVVDTMWEGEPAFLASLRDITQRKRDQTKIRDQQAQLEAANAKLQSLATLDGLTGLKNHRTFQERLHEEFCRAVDSQLALSLILMDVDHFKQFNDTFGHLAGDDVLKRVAALLSENARETDLVARYGGEEFVELLPNTGLDQALVIAERIRQMIATAPWKLRVITASFGVATLRADIINHQGLVSAADAALYHAKQNGRNRVIHEADLQSGFI